MDRGLVSNSLKNEYPIFYKVSGCLHPNILIPCLKVVNTQFSVRVRYPVAYI